MSHLSPLNHLSNDQLTLAYFQEGGPEVAEAQREHLSRCPQCAENYRRLAHFLDAMRDVPLPEKSPGWEQRIWEAMAPQVSENLGRRRSGFRYWALVPVLAGVLALAFLAGMYTQHRFAKDSKSFSVNGRERVLLIALGDHLDRSQIVLAELVNAPEGQTADISTERQLAGDLLSENRLLRQTSIHHGDTGNAAVLDQLERVLTDISHSPDEVSAGELDELRGRIEAENLLFKVRVVSTNAHEKGMKL
jgi:hypothetical protein